VSDANPIDLTKLPEPVAERSFFYRFPLAQARTDNKLSDVHLIPDARDESGLNALYNPIIYPNEFWNLRSQFTEINSTTTTLPLRIILQPMSYFKFQLFASMTVGFREAAKQQGGGGSEMDEVKRMLVETNPYLLGLTGLVTILHMV
jgi:Cleft lip and palate transmembrane protein 1 (CLPTM1)